MGGFRQRSLLPFAMVIGLFVALVLLALLQNRWITRLADAERQSMETRLKTAATQFCDGIDRELARAFQVFRQNDETPGDELGSQLAARLVKWRVTTSNPELVKEVLLVRRLGRDEVELLRFDESSGKFLPSSWNAGLESVRRIFLARGRIPLLDAALPGIVLPVNRTQPPQGSENPDFAGQSPPRDHVIVRLDLGFLQREFFPRLDRRSARGQPVDPDGKGFRGRNPGQRWTTRDPGGRVGIASGPLQPDRQRHEVRWIGEVD